MKRGIIVFAGIFLSFLLAVPSITIGAEGKVGKVIKVIDKSNVDEVKDLLPITLVNQVKEWGLKFNWVEGDYNYQPPKEYRDATEKYKGTCSVDSSGNLVNYVAGLPFPDPKSGIEVLWNFDKRYSGDDHKYNGSVGKMMDKKGRRRSITMDFNLIRYNGRTQLSPLHEIPTEEGVKKKTLSVMTKPQAVNGTGVLNITYNDPNRENDLWFYVPSLRRTVRASAARGSDNYGGTDTTWDDIYVWSGRIQHATYKLLGKKEVLAVVDEGLNERPDDSGGFLQGGNYQKVPVYEIEAVHKNPKYPYSKSIWWVDPQTWEIIYSVIYDRKGSLWKSIQQRLYWTDNGTHFAHNMPFNDYQTRHFTNWIISDYTENNNKPTDFFTLESLRKLGR
jgi:hypothetical protein